VSIDGRTGIFALKMPDRKNTGDSDSDELV